MNQDVWALTDLGYTEEELKISGIRNLYFTNFSLPWLKLLAKLTAKAIARNKHSVDIIRSRNSQLKQLDEFLISTGYTQPQLLENTLLQEFIAKNRQRQSTINYITKLWAEEQWLKLDYISIKLPIKRPKIETIPEEVLHQVYENFDLFPAPLERFFRLQIILGCRLGELLKIPRQCLKQEGEKWFLLRWIEKQKNWKFYQIHPLVAELILEQQKFLDTKLGSNSDFDKLFCKISTYSKNTGSRGNRFKVEPVYLSEVLNRKTIYAWLKDFSEKAHLKDKHGNKFNLTSHMFRRTKASIMAYCEAEDEYIAAVLGHSSLDMLPHYRKRSLERLEKEANAKNYVDMYGRVTSFKPRKRRYEQLADIMEIKVSTSLGECHRPTMLGDCQYRYACLGCGYHRVTEEDKPKIEIDIKNLETDLKQANTAGKKRTSTEINRLLELLKTRLQGLNKINNLNGD
ncbi:MAG: site-specific integrase [Prochloraceae cyanobacterium]|nr:site-specific integrase [Prochloraceae cyanobacterium]